MQIRMTYDGLTFALNILSFFQSANVVLIVLLTANTVQCFPGSNLESLRVENSEDRQVPLWICGRIHY